MFGSSVLTSYLAQETQSSEHNGSGKKGNDHHDEGSVEAERTVSHGALPVASSYLKAPIAAERLRSREPRDDEQQPTRGDVFYRHTFWVSVSTVAEFGNIEAGERNYGDNVGEAQELTVNLEIVGLLINILNTIITAV